MSIRNELLEDILAAIQGGGGSPTVNEVAILTGRGNVAAQNPAGTDSPLQVTFGPAQGSGADPVQIDAAGNLTINETNGYRLTITLQAGRLGASGVSLLYGRLLVNGVQSGGSVVAELDNANIVIPLQFNVLATLPATSVVTVEIYRDSAGNDSGGLINSIPTLAGWAHAETATIQVSRLEVTP